MKYKKNKINYKGEIIETIYNYEIIDKLVKRIIHQGLYLSTPIQLEFHENQPFIHQRGNNECGMYSLYFIITMLTSRDGNEKKNQIGRICIHIHL